MADTDYGAEFVRHYDEADRLRSQLDLFGNTPERVQARALIGSVLALAAAVAASHSARPLTGITAEPGPAQAMVDLMAVPAQATPEASHYQRAAALIESLPDTWDATLTEQFAHSDAGLVATQAEASHRRLHLVIDSPWEPVDG